MPVRAHGRVTRRPHQPRTEEIARAVGAGLEEAGASLSAAPLLPPLVGTLLGSPGGIGLYAVNPIA